MAPSLCAGLSSLSVYLERETTVAEFPQFGKLNSLHFIGDGAFQGKPRSARRPTSEHWFNRRFLEITGEDNLTVFSYSGRVKSPEWRWQRRRADLRHFEIFRHGPIIIYTRLPAWGTYYPICTFPASSECLIGISDAFSAFCLRVSDIFPTCSLYPQQKRAYFALHLQAWTYIYKVHAQRLLPSAVPWISEDRLLPHPSSVYLHR